MKNRMTLSGAFLLMLGIATGLIGLSVGGGRALAAQHEVDIDNLAFAPAVITLNGGDSVRCVNSDNGTLVRLDFPLQRDGEVAEAPAESTFEPVRVSS